MRREGLVKRDGNSAWSVRQTDGSRRYYTEDSDGLTEWAFTPDGPRPLMPSAQESQESPAQLGAWVLEAQVMSLVPDSAYPWPTDVVRALREIDPSIAPLTVTKVYRLPDGSRERMVRFLLARLITQPRAPWSRAGLADLAIWGVTRPTEPVPRAIRGLPGGPYIEADLLETVPTDVRRPGEFMPLTNRSVEELRAAAWGLRNRRQADQSLARRDRVRARARAREAAARALLDADEETEWSTNKAAGTLPPRVSLGGNVTMSQTLADLRAAAAA